MKVKGFWLVVVALAAGALGAFLFRGCGKTKTVTWCPPVDMDSLRATIPPDTILVPGSQVVKFIPEKVNLKDTAAIDSLLRQFQEMQGYYAGLTDQLKNAIGRKDSAVANAMDKNPSVDPDGLVVRTAFVDEGFRMKRVRPAPMGRAYRVQKRTCHITLELGREE